MHVKSIYQYRTLRIINEKVYFFDKNDKWCCCNINNLSSQYLSGKVESFINDEYMKIFRSLLNIRNGKTAIRYNLLRECMNRLSLGDGVERLRYIYNSAFYECNMHGCDIDSKIFKTLDHLFVSYNLDIDRKMENLDERSFEFALLELHTAFYFDGDKVKLIKERINDVKKYIFYILYSNAHAFFKYNVSVSSLQITKMIVNKFGDIYCKLECGT